MKKIRTLLLGLGRISTLLEKDPYRIHPCTHAGVLFSKFGKKNFVVSGFFDIVPDRVFQFAKDWNINLRKISTDLKDIENSGFDLCIIASSSASHYENALFAIQKNIKNILIEKPAC